MQKFYIEVVEYKKDCTGYPYAETLGVIPLYAADDSAASELAEKLYPTVSLLWPTTTPPEVIK